MSSENDYHNAPDESGDLMHTDPFEYLQAEQDELEAQPKAVADLILHSDCSKSANEYRGSYMARQVHDGHINALEFAIKGRAMVKSIEAALDETKDDTIREIAKYGKEAEMFGSKVEVKEAGVKYDFSHCNDIVYTKLLSELEAAKEKVKKRETFLKAITGHADLFDEETGETWQAYPPRKTSTTTYAITHK